jgi:LysR family hydrogen peroxide-inducible transcriptional activator
MRRLLLEADDLVEAAVRLGDPLTGTLRIGVIPTISPYLLPRVAPRLRARFPRLVLEWLEDRTATLIAGLNAGTLDAALLALEADIGEVESAVIATDPFVLAAPPAHALGKRATPASTAELRGTEVLLLDDGHCFRDQALEVCAGAQAQELGFRATSLSTLVQMVAGGAGVTLLPALAVPTEAARAKLRVRSFARPAPHRTIALVWRKRSPLAPALGELAAVIRDAYPSASPAGARKSSRAA